MKRIWMLLLAAVLLLPAMALAEYDYSEVMDDYDMIVSRYQKAVAESYAYARDDFQGLLNYYEAKPERKAALDGHNDSQRIYYYAKGRVAIYDGSYSEACNWFSICGLNYGHYTQQYYYFAQGMNYMENGNYADALKALENARTLTELSAEATTQIINCRERYAEQLLTLGDLYDQQGDHEKAREYYQTVNLQLNNPEGKRRYDACVAHSNAAAVKRTLNILYGESLDDGSVVVEWEGFSDAYLVYLSMDLIANAQDPVEQVTELAGGQETTVAWPADRAVRAAKYRIQYTSGEGESNERTMKIMGLLPGVMYRLEIVDAADSTVFSVRGVMAEAAELMEGSEYYSESLWRYDLRAYASSKATMDESASLHKMLLNRNKVTSLDNGEINLSQSSLRKEGVYLNLTLGADEEKEALRGKEYTMLLYLNDLGTIMENGSFFTEKAAEYGGNKITFLLDDLLEAAETRYGSIVGKEWLLQILVDDQLLYAMNGVIR